jgi:hypothetical protein
MFISLSTQSGNFWIHPRITTDVKEIGWKVVDWIHLADSCQNGNDPMGKKKKGGELNN